MTVRDIVQAAAGVSTGNPNAWDISKAFYDVGDAAGDLSKARPNGGSQAIQTQDLTPTDLFVSTDGSIFYMLGGTGDDVNEYTATFPWFPSVITYVRNFSVASQESAPTGLFFKPDGTKMYIVGTANDTVYQYSLSTAWNLSTASYDSVSKSVSAQDTSPQGVAFKTDGTKMYIVGGTGVDINEYTLSTAWDVSSASYSQNFSVSAQDSTPKGVSFALEGTKMYVVGEQNENIYEYTLSTPWDVSSATYVQSVSVNIGLTNNQTGVCVRENGYNIYNILYVPSNNTALLSGRSFGGFSVTTEELSPTGLFFKPDGTKMYIIGLSGDEVNEYDLSTAWDITSASYLQTFSVSAQEASPLDLFFKDDGTKMYILGSSGDDVNEYDLSTPWDISTASYLQNFSVATEEINPQGLFFKPDGTKMYICGSTGDDVNEYDLSTAWDISSASYLQNFSVSAQEIVPSGVSFKSDGTKMYIIGTSGRDINEYTLATPWDVSSASFVQNFAVTAQAGNPTGMFWRPNGEQFFVVGSTTDTVFSYLISPD